MRLIPRALALACGLCVPGCLVVSVNPTYDAESIGWDAALVGHWEDTDDNVTVQIERGEWKSYRLHYVHPIETGDLTGYLTIIGDTRYLDVMPARGEDRGSFLIPVHAVFRLQLDGDRLEVTPLSFDWFYERLRGGVGVPGLTVALDQKDNALVATPTSGLRDWLRHQPPGGPMFGASAVFRRKPAATSVAARRGISWVSSFREKRS
ncbi:MAG: hypothetical protein LC753_02300 [Acidobacteria bacterium]|nr:hypothetical protein [Acidobacteriota bacterium]MCA1649136.1 hypothetical protein [Acidobacteriota bacterium]